jgi:G patch domain-containing protein 1
VGRRIKRKARLGDDDENDTEAETLHFAPEDTKMIGFVRKDDCKGLGFKGGGSLKQVGDEADDDDASLLAASKSRMLRAKEKSKKASFGVGVLNDTGSDEEDPYELGPKLTFNRSIGTGKKIKKATDPQKLIKSSPTPSIVPRQLNRSAKILSQQSTIRLRRTHDGKLPLAGFVLSSKGASITLTKAYPPPPIPETWTPSKQNHSTNLLQPKPWQSTVDAAKSSTLTPAQRGSLLAEPQLPTKSVFAYLTPTARAKIATATGNSKLPPAGVQEATETGNQPPSHLQPESSTPSSAQTQTQPSPWSLIPPLSPKTAQAALSRARISTDSTTAPYATDPDKARRYVAYLEFSAGVRASPPEKGKMGEEEWVREMGEFGKVAGLGRLGGLMAGRFSAASARTRATGEEEEEVGEGEGIETRMSVHGGLARTVEKFFPTRLLCKRFNVKAPAHVLDPGAEVGGELAGARVEEPVGRKEMEKMMVFGTTQGIGGGVDGDGGLRLKMRELVVVDPEKNEAIEKERPPIEVFKAIFGEDDDDE